MTTALGPAAPGATCCECDEPIDGHAMCSRCVTKVEDAAYDEGASEVDEEAPSGLHGDDVRAWFTRYRLLHPEASIADGVIEALALDIEEGRT